MNTPTSKHDPTSHVPVPYPEEHRDWWRVFTQVTQLVGPDEAGESNNQVAE